MTCLDNLAAFDLSTRQAASLVGVGHSTMQRWCRQHPAIARRINGRLRVSRDRLATLLDTFESRRAVSGAARVEGVA